MKFAHLADCHVGAWREPKLRELTVQAFTQTIDICIKERVDFVILAGDLFHTAIPSLDGVKAVFKQLTKLKQADIPVYFITGSHDYSPTGKTMLDVIEEADLGKNIFRGEVSESGVLKMNWTMDAKTGVKLTGILGRANQLDSAIYTQLDRATLEQEDGEKIFVFHTSIAELKSNGAVFDSSPLSLLPLGCRYYAGGHVHQKIDTVIEGRHIVYPGPLFPASFSELEELHTGSFCIVENWKVKRVLVNIKSVKAIKLDCAKLTPMEVVEKIRSQTEEVKESIVLLRLHGTLAGKPSDIPWRQVQDELIAKGAYVVLRNTAELTSPELERNVVSIGSVDEIEQKVLSEHKVDVQLVKELMRALSSEKQDGERQQAYEERVVAAARTTLSQVKN